MYIKGILNAIKVNDNLIKICIVVFSKKQYFYCNKDVTFPCFYVFRQQTRSINFYRVLGSHLTHHFYFLQTHHINKKLHHHPEMHHQLIQQLITSIQNYIPMEKALHGTTRKVVEMIHKQYQKLTDTCIMQWEFMVGQCT